MHRGILLKTQREALISEIYFWIRTLHFWGTGWCSWLRQCATSQRVAGSILGGVIGIFHCHNPSGHTMALGLAQPLTEMSTSNISWEGGGEEAAGAQGWQHYHLRVPIVLKSGSLNLLKPSGPLQACYGIALPFTLHVSDSISVHHQEFSTVDTAIGTGHTGYVDFLLVVSS